jgi:hypothetical protein
MQRNRVISLAALGTILGIAGIISSQYMLALVILVFIVLVLFIADFKQWVELLVEKIAAGNRVNPPDAPGINETIASIRAEIQRIDQRLETLEKKTR